MNSTIKTILIAAVVTITATNSFAGSTQDERADRVVYNQLVRELRRIHNQYAMAIRKGVTQAQNNDGKASYSSKAKILALRDEFDHKMTRLTLVALRYGWNIPDFKGGPKKEVTNTVSGKEQIFAPADALITEAFRYQAEQIALTVRLPVISVSVATTKRS